MSFHREPALAQSCLPSLPCADGAGVIEQAVLFFLGGEAGKSRVERVVAEEEALPAVEDGRVGAVGVVVAVDLPGAQVELDAAEQGRVRVGSRFG